MTLPGTIAQPRVTIRNYRERDLEACQEVRGETFDFNQYVHLPNYHFLLAEDPESAILGYAVMQIWDWNKSGCLADLFVSREKRCQGVGRALMERIKSIAAARSCQVLIDYVPVEAAYLAFYFKLGFEVFGYHADYLSLRDGRRTDVIIFGLRLD